MCVCIYLYGGCPHLNDELIDCTAPHKSATPYFVCGSVYAFCVCMYANGWWGGAATRRRPAPTCRDACAKMSVRNRVCIIIIIIARNA